MWGASSLAGLVLSCFFRVHPLGGLFLAHAEAGLHCTVQSITPPWAGCSCLILLLCVEGRGSGEVEKGALGGKYTSYCLKITERIASSQRKIVCQMLPKSVRSKMLEGCTSK